MDIFLSWSGTRSKRIAEILEGWLPRVAPQYKPWISNRIRAGERWSPQLMERLRKSSAGIFCVTPENLTAPWLIFEAGALSNTVDGVSIIPLLYEIDPEALNSPLSLFQSTNVTKDGMLKLLRDLNYTDGHRLEEETLETLFKPKWQEFEEAIKGVPAIDVESETVRAFNVEFDCTTQEFQQHLTECQSATIIGVTNENLIGHLRNAWQTRQGQKKGAWEELRIIFAAQHLLDNFPLPDGFATEEAALASRLTRWENGVREIRRFLLGAGKDVTERPAKHVDIRSYDKPLTFVGQLYDQRHIRVAFILPDEDLQRSCYITFHKDVSPCRNVPISSSRHSDEGDGPPCKRGNMPKANCDGCNWKEHHSPCQSIFKAMNRIVSGSTPLFSANVVGHVPDPQDHQMLEFQLSCLCPQNNWRDFNLWPNADNHPAHLLAFVLLRKGENILLQFRNDSNSSGELNKYGMIPGKVNGEDFLDDPLDQKYRKAVYGMQIAWDKMRSRGEPSALFLDQFHTVQGLFSAKARLSLGEAVPDARLTDACKKAARRILREKLGLEIGDNRLKDHPRSFVVRRDAHSLFIKVFTLNLERYEVFDRTSANLRPITHSELVALKEKRHLTDFLDQNLDYVVDCISRKEQ